MPDKVPSPLVMRSVWCGVILLVAIGVTASIFRGLFIGDLATRAEPVRSAIIEKLGITDPNAAERASQVARMDASFGTHRVATFLHIISGAVFLLLAPLQFSQRVRTRHLRFHRWSGRLLLAMAIIAAATGSYFGLLMPFGGRGESIVIALVAIFFLGSLAKAIVAIKRRDVARHRVWMIRAFGAAIAISTIRLVATVVDLTLTPRGMPLPAAFVLALWIGWGVTIAAAEVWIRLGSET